MMYRAREIGISICLAKPVKRQELKEAIQTAFGKAAAPPQEKAPERKEENILGSVPSWPRCWPSGDEFSRPVITPRRTCLLSPGTQILKRCHSGLEKLKEHGRDKHQ